MKVNVEIDCTPEEARRFLGFPDVTKANDVYVDAMTKAMKGAPNVDQLQDFAKQLAPMGAIGMNLFEQVMKSGPAAFSACAEGAKGRKRGED